MARVNVIHGIPDVIVTVCVNGEAAIPSFEYKNIVTVQLEPGEYQFAVFDGPGAACTEDGSGALLGPVDRELVGGENVSIIAHLTADGDSALSVFDNDISPARPGMARVVVHHTAQAPVVFATIGRFTESALDITTPPFGNVTEESEAPIVAQLRPGNWEVTLYPEVEEETDPMPPPAFGPVPVQLRPHTLYLVYAVGALDSQFDLLLLPVPLSLF